MVSQFVNGMEGKDMNGNLLPAGNGYYKTTTTIKHYAMNNSEVNRRAGSSRTPTTGRSASTTPRRSAGSSRPRSPAPVMSSYNSVNGAPTAADPYLIDTLMRADVRLPGLLHRRLRRGLRGINPRTTGSPPASAAPADRDRALAFALGAGEDAGVQRRLHEREQLPRPDRARHDRRRDDERDRHEHHDGDGPAHVNDLDVSRDAAVHRTA